METYHVKVLLIAVINLIPNIRSNLVVLCQFLKTDCNPLGMESQSISDSQITASSEHDPSHGAGNARLNFRAGSGRTGAWSALLPDSSPWLQVDFTRIVALAKIATQGRSDYDQWVTGYSLSYSVDGNYFPMYKLCGEIKVRKD